MTEPAVGAWTWASGSQVCTGHIGIFTAKEAKKASHSQGWTSAGRRRIPFSAGMLVVPASLAIHSMASSSSDPSRV